MSNYTQVNDYSAKDVLSSGDPSKKILGADIDAELAAIATAITSKADDSGVVHTTGTETVAGDKTFSGNNTHSGAQTVTGIATYSKIVKWAKGADVASANALTLGDDGNYFNVTGTTAVTSIATKGTGTVVKLHFNAALTLTHHATNLILPGGVNIITAAGDEAEFAEYGTGTWRLTSYTPNILRPVSGVIARDATEQNVINDATEQTVFTTTVPAGWMGTDRQLRFVAYGIYTNNSGVDQGIIYRLKLGGTTWATIAANAITTSASNRGWYITGYISNQSANNAQRSWAELIISAADADGDTVTLDKHGVSFKNSLAIDTSVDCTFALSVDHDNASAAIAVNTTFAILHLE